MITVERRTGQMVEARFEGALTAPMLKEFGASLSQIVLKAGTRLVFVVDFRECEPFDAPMEAMILGRLRSDNFAIARSAFLLRPETPTCTQMERIIQLGKTPDRRSFTTIDDLMAWMGEVLSADEIKRAIDFFAERT